MYQCMWVVQHLSFPTAQLCRFPAFPPLFECLCFCSQWDFGARHQGNGLQDHIGITHHKNQMTVLSNHRSCQTFRCLVLSISFSLSCIDCTFSPSWWHLIKLSLVILSYLPSHCCRMYFSWLFNVHSLISTKGYFRPSTTNSDLTISPFSFNAIFSY
jgi:hypothetical protein